MKRTSGKRKKILAICLAVTVVIGCLLCGCSSNDSIADNVTVAGVNVGGMTRRDAISAVRQAVSESYKTSPMEVTVDGHSISLSPEMTGADLIVGNAIDLALAADAGTAVDISSCLNLNNEVIKAAVKELMANFGSQLTQPTYMISGADGMDKTLIVTMGKPGYGLTYDDVLNEIYCAYSANLFTLSLSSEIKEPDAVDLDTIYKETYIEPVNAAYDPETKGTTDHILGYSFNMDEAKELIKDAKYGENVSIPYTCIEPEIKKGEMEKLLFKDVLSTYTAKSGSVSGRDTNLKLACEAVNGVVLQPGEVFDYNKTLGERTAEKGYKYGASYIGNKTVSTIGGGICQVSSTIYYCALMADMEIVTRTNHGFLNSYVPMGMDATVAWGGPEFRFKNNSDFPIRIEAYAEAGHTTVTIYGTDVKDYYVKMEYDLLATYPWSRVEQEMPADNPDGYKDGDVISTAYTGYKVVTYRCKYDKETNELISKEQETMNYYNKRDYVICKIVTEETTPTETTAPSETTAPPETTEPPETSEPTEVTPAPEPPVEYDPDGTITEDG